MNVRKLTGKYPVLQAETKKVLSLPFKEKESLSISIQKQ
jgi:hypothetical protein